MIKSLSAANLAKEQGSLLGDALGDSSDVAGRAKHSCGKLEFFFRADPIEFCFHR